MGVAGAVTPAPPGIEAERAVLAVIIRGQHPETVEQLLLAGGAALFDDRDHRAISGAIATLHAGKHEVDTTTVINVLRQMPHGPSDQTMFDAVGMAPFDRISETVSTLGSFTTNLATLVALHHQRLAIGETTRALADMRGAAGAKKLPVVIAGLTERLAALTSAPPAPTLPIAISPKTLLGYDVGADPNTLLGDRWLSKSGSCVIVGQTGLGKSSFCMQAATTWGLSESLFGIRPVRELSSLIVQAENDIGDLAEMFRGVEAGLGREDRIGELEERLHFVTDTSHSGEEFFPFVRALIEQYRPDLVWIDPLFAFIGGNISEQETTSAFLRNGLGAIAQETGVCWMVMHHTNKPKDANGSTLAPGDYSYLGSGSAELANWARAVLVLREAGDAFELRAAKRGRRAGLVDSSGKPATEVYLRHADHGICWVRAPTPESAQDMADREQVQDVLGAMEIGKNYTYHDVRELVMSELAVKRSAVMTKGRKANRILLNVLAQTRVTGKPDCHAVTVRHNGCHVTGSEVTVTGVTSPYRGIDPAVTPPGVSDGEVLSQQHEHEPSMVEGEL